MALNTGKNSRVSDNSKWPGQASKGLPQARLAVDVLRSVAGAFSLPLASQKAAQSGLISSHHILITTTSII
jgi:hypothetical protein